MKRKDLSKDRTLELSKVLGEFVEIDIIAYLVLKAGGRVDIKLPDDMTALGDIYLHEEHGDHGAYSLEVRKLEDKSH